MLDDHVFAFLIIFQSQNYAIRFIFHNIQNSMNYKASLLILISIIAVNSAKQWYEQNNPVFLTSGNVKEAIGDTQSIKIIKFFTPWCRYCRYMKPIIDDFHKLIKEQQVTYVKFYQINCDQENRVCEKFDVLNYPHIKVIGFDGQIIGEIGGFQPKQKVFDYLYGLIQDLTAANPQFFDNEDVVQRNDRRIEYQMQNNFNKEQNHEEDQNLRINSRQQNKPTKKEQELEKKPEFKSLTHENIEQKQGDASVAKKQNKGFQITITLDHILRVCLYVVIGAFGGYYLKDILKNYQKGIQAQPISYNNNCSLTKNPQCKQQTHLKNQSSD